MSLRTETPFTSDPRYNVLYANPSIYDIVSSPGTARELDVLERADACYGRGIRRGAVWLEPACGSGRFLRLIARRGRRVVGIDISPSQVAYARESLWRRGLSRRTRVLVADMTSFSECVSPRSIDFAFNTVNSIRHLMSDRVMLAHFAQIARVLKPGGVYAVGISLTDYAAYMSDEDVWIGARGPCRVTHVVNYLPVEHGGAKGRRERVISHLMVERPSSTTHIDGRFDLRTYDEKQWLALLRRSALRRVAVLDAKGETRRDQWLAYQMEVLAPRQ